MSSDFHKGTPPKHFHYARENRKSPTIAERILWNHIRNRQLQGFKFRRQHPIGDFIADFYCHECRVVVEIDGGYHSETAQKQYDQERTLELSGYGLHVIRFTNREVIEDLRFVLRRLASYLSKYSSDS